MPVKAGFPPYRHHFRLWPPLILLALLFLASGCFGAGSKLGGRAEMREFDLAEISPDTLNVLVADFDWQYYNEGVHLKVTGEVMNATGAPLHSVTLYGIFYDEYEQTIGQAKAFIYPTYLKEGGRGTFEMTVMNSKGKRQARHIRLVTTAKSLGQ